MIKLKAVFCLLLIFAFLFIITTQVNAKDNETYLTGSHYGNIRKKLVVNQKELLAVSTMTNLYLLNHEKIVTKISLNNEIKYLEVLHDVNHNGYDELLLITKNSDEDTILVYDTLANTLLYQYGPKMEAYDSIRGYYNENVEIEDYLIHDSHLIGIAGYLIFSFNLETGHIDWQVKAENNLWDIEEVGDINQDKVNDIAVSLQPSFVLFLSSTDGTILYQHYISEPITNQLNEKIETNIWSIKYDFVRNWLYLASENGTLYVFDPLKKKIIKKETIYQINKNNFTSNQVTKQKENFKKLSIQLVSDFTGDQKPDLIYFQMTKPYTYQKDIYSFTNPQAKLYLLNGTDLSIIKEIPLIGDYYGANYYIQNQIIYLLDSFTEQSIIYKRYSIKDKTYLSDLTLMNEQYIIKYRDTTSYYSFLPFSDDTMIIFADNELVFVKNGVMDQEIPFVKIEELNLLDNKLLKINRIRENTGFVNVEMINAKTNKTIWEKEFKDDFLNGQIDSSHDMTGDKENNLVLVNPLTKTFLLVDGENGDELSQLTLDVEEIKNYGFYGDMNQDGYAEYYVQLTDGSLFILDFKNKQIKQVNDFNFPNVYGIGDINQDEKLDFIQFVYTDSSYTLNQITSDNNQFNCSSGNEVNEKIVNVNDHFGDIDRDQIEDIAFLTTNNNESYFHVISSKTGKELLSIPCHLEDTFYLSDVDMNQDGYKEIFRINNQYQENQATIMLYQDSLTFQSVIYTSDVFEPTYEMVEIKPAVVFLTDEGFTIGIHTNSLDKESSTLSFYDLNNNLLNEIHVGKKTETNTLAGLSVINYDDQFYFYPTDVSISYDPFLYHYNDNKIIAYYSQDKIMQLVMKNQWIYLQNTSGQMVTYHLKEPITIDIKNKQKINQHTTIHFNNPSQLLIGIYVDQQSIGKTNKDTYQLNLLKGEHKIEFRTESPEGIEQVITLTVEVVDQNWYKYALGFITTGLFILIYFLQKQKKEDKDE